MDRSIGHGTVIQRSDDATSGGVFTSVGEIYDTQPPGITRDAVENTTMASIERWREFMGGLKDAGELSFTITFDPDAAEITALELDLNTDTPGFYKIIFPDADEWGFAALLTAFQPTVPVGDAMLAEVTFKLTGKPGWIA